MSDLEDKINELTDTPDTTDEYDPEDIKNNKALAIVSYLSLLVLFPLIAMRDSKFVKFHVNQGLVLAIAEILAYFAVRIISYIPIVRIGLGIVRLVLVLLFVVLSLLGIINAANGKAKELPFIGKIRLIK